MSSSPEPVQLDFPSLTNALKAAGEPTRLRLLFLLGRGELTVTELTQVLGQSQPRISRHLKLLQEAGLVDRFREGSWVFYRLKTHHPLLELLADNEAAMPPADLKRLADVRKARAETASAYFQDHAEDWHRIRALHLPEEEVEDALVEMVGKEPLDRLIDLGTGTGRMLEVFGPQSQEALGIDSSLEMLRLARSKLDQAGLNHCRVRQADIFTLDLLEDENLDRGADLVVIHQVLHYLAEPRQAFEIAASMVRPGGRLVLIDFAPHEMEFLREAHTHRRLGFSDDEIRDWFKRAGLSLCDERHLEARKAGPRGPSKDKLTVSIWIGRAGVKSNKARAAA